MGLRIAQADAGSIHQHIHNQVEADGQSAQQEESHAHVFHHDVERREYGNDTTLDEQDVDLTAVFIGLFHKIGQLTLFSRPEQATAGTRDP